MSCPVASPLDRDSLPRFLPPHDPGFRPMILSYRRYFDGMAPGSGASAVPLRIALERESGFVSTFETLVPGEGAEEGLAPFIVERIVKFLLWSRGGWRIRLQGPASVGEHIRAAYRPGGARDFDVRLMSRVYEKAFEVVLVGADGFPEARESPEALGGHWEGCRIGFDLGASDYKVAAVMDGVPRFSEEIPWSPGEAADPEYHYRHIMDGLKKAAAHLPRVDAIGGSSAGIYIGNLVRIASLFRSVPDELFETKIKPLFLRVRDEWKVPFEVINDGEVTALAGMMSLGDTAVLGVAMGSSEAAGFLNGQGHITGWLDELAFAPVDANPDAPVDEWSGDRGVGANYFSQQAVNRLALAAGLKFPDAMRLPERLKHVQALAEAGDSKAAGVFESIGIYLGYTIPWYGAFYDYRNLLVLGRVLSGRGGNIIVAKARDVLRAEFPETAARMRLQLLDEKSRRVGQAVAAASLPGVSRPDALQGVSS